MTDTQAIVFANNLVSCMEYKDKYNTKEAQDLKETLKVLTKLATRGIMSRNLAKAVEHYKEDTEANHLTRTKQENTK